MQSRSQQGLHFLHTRLLPLLLLPPRSRRLHQGFNPHEQPCSALLRTQRRLQAGPAQPAAVNLHTLYSARARMLLLAGV